MENIFKNKVVIVTGGNSGIGKELVRELHGYGARLYICGRNRTTGQALIRELAGSGQKIVFHVVDVQDAESVERYVSEVLKAEGHIDYLFHLAGVILGGEIRDHRIEDVQKVLSINVLGTATVSHYVYRQMAEQGYGHIINVASAAGLFPLPLMGMYGASKFAVYGMTEALRLEGKGLGVKVSTVAPGIVDTPIYDRGTYSKTDKHRAKGLLKNRASTISPEKAAQKILKGVRKNKAVIFTQQYAHFSWLSYRYFPHVFRFVTSRYLGPYRKSLRKPNDA